LRARAVLHRPALLRRLPLVINGRFQVSAILHLSEVVLSTPFAL